MWVKHKPKQRPQQATGHPLSTNTTSDEITEIKETQTYVYTDTHLHRPMFVLCPHAQSEM